MRLRHVKKYSARRFVSVRKRKKSSNNNILSAVNGHPNHPNSLPGGLWRGIRLKMAQPLGIRTNVLSRTVTRSLCPRLHSPTIFFADTQSQFTVQYRSFSQSPIPNVKAGLMSAPQIKPKMPAEMSTRSRLKNIPPEQMPTDFGVLPGTFIKPDAKDMPSLFKNPRDRLRMEWIWIRHWVQNVIGSVSNHLKYSLYCH